MSNVFRIIFESGIVPDQSEMTATIAIPKQIEAEIFRTVPAWWWRTPRKPPQVPIHLITAERSQFYQQGLPQGMRKVYQIDYSVVQGGHMFPLEHPKTANHVKARLKKL